MQKELEKFERKMIDESKDMEKEMSRKKEMLHKEHEEISKIVAEVEKRTLRFGGIACYCNGTK